MQYILSQEEIDGVNNLRKQMKGFPSRNRLREMCTKIADTILDSKYGDTLE